MTDATEARRDATPVPPAQSIAFLLSQLGFASARQFKQVLSPVQLEPRQFALLRYVEAAEGQSQQSLGDALHIPASRMVAIVDELEERQLLERRRSTSDRRAHALYLTSKGRRVLPRALKLAMQHEEIICGTLTPAEREQLALLLQKLADAQGLVFGVHPGLTHPGEETWRLE